jgi:hypothetical protein
LTCRQPADVPVVEIYNQKLYLSEIQALLPDGISQEDSLVQVRKYIDEWIHHQIMLREANRLLSATERNFEKELQQYRQTLLIQAYLEKLTSDTSQFSYSNEELSAFFNKYELDFQEENKFVRLNYIKISPKQKQYKELKNILFDDTKRIMEKARIEELCGNTIEYFITDHTWLNVENIHSNLSAQFADLDSLPKNYKMEITEGNYSYLIVLLEIKKERKSIENTAAFSAAKAMFLQEKKAAFIKEHIDSLYKEAVKFNLIIH